MWWGHMNDYGWGWGGMGIGMLLIWILLMVVLVLLAKSIWNAGAGKSGSPEKSALDILKERYARGEIGREEYEQKKRDLTE